MSMPPVPVPCISTFRARIKALLARENAGGAPRDVVILAIDGVPYGLAAALWKAARVSMMESVFPTTSSSAWLSSLTGLSVADHGIPGVVFLADDGRLINVFDDDGSLPAPAGGNLFSDAAASGYAPVAPVGEWAGMDCGWLRALLHGAAPVDGERFYTGPEPRTAAGIGTAVLHTVRQCCARRRAGTPVLVWCFIEADRHIHHHGYDEPIMEFLASIDGLAARIAADLNAVTIAHSDHGLVPTRHVPEIDAFFDHLGREHGARLGGAGRTRWIYPRAGSAPAVLASLARSLPPSVRVCPADEVFAPGSLARKRVGDIVLIAEGDEFVTFSGQCYDHGSCGDGERYVPYAAWNA